METKEDHIKYIIEKEKKTLDLFEEQMIKGKTFGRSNYDKLDELDVSFSDFEAKRKKEENPTEDLN